MHRGSAYLDAPQSLLKTPWALSYTLRLMELLRSQWMNNNDSIWTDPISVTLSHTLPLKLELLQPQ